VERTSKPRTNGRSGSRWPAILVPVPRVGFYFKFEISNFKSKIASLKFPISNRMSLIANLRFPISILKCAISNLESQISNVKFEILPLSLCFSAALFLSACGYHVGGTASTLPPGLKVIAVPAIKNDTPRYRVEQLMTEAVVREFIARTKYRIVPSENSADAVLHGEITSFEAVPVVFDTTPTTTPSSTAPLPNVTTARATTMLVSVHIKVLLEQRETGKTLYKNDDYLFREPYEISTDPAKFFDEQGPAIDRMSRDFAARLVSDVLENF
jgi:lipopolysaccharide assembly LptE-like protein